ncbi:MAG: Ig-like domain-containing protein [Clostridia bacterium]|nr:Ig-like domain-containing protein [Clostridia bacterium]
MHNTEIHHKSVSQNRKTPNFFAYIAFFLLILAVCPAMTIRAEAAGVQTVQVGTPLVEARPELFLPRSLPTRGEGKIAVFLIDFPDKRNANPHATREYYDGLYFSGGADNHWGTTVSAFFQQQSYGKLHLSGQVFDWYTAKHERSYYDDRKAELVLEAAEHYQSFGTDFSQFDGNDDGILDSVIFHFAGEYSLDKTDPWYTGSCYGHALGFGEVEGLRLKTFIQLNDTACAGTNYSLSAICHELVHALGMPDLYNDLYHSAISVMDLMSAEDQTINPYTKILLGWIESVRVITEDAQSIRLNADTASDPGVAIVTDEFTGFLDEFFVVGYRNFYQFKTAVIWHVDARLNEDKTALMNHNFTYDPLGGSSGSPYLFIEEISADPNTNFFFEPPFSPEASGFGTGALLGPDTVPSSDTHDGEHTGILITNFAEHNKTHITFDVSFVKDTALPRVTTTAEELEFETTVRLTFSEHIYKGDAWNDIRITDTEGNPLGATVCLSYYPRNEITITFADETYKNGYRISLPKNCIRDAVGNGIAPVTLTASASNVFSPVSSAPLPDAGTYMRGSPTFFHAENSLVVITPLKASLQFGEKIEFLRLDGNGAVLVHKIIDNPFGGVDIVYTIDVGDGNYLCICRSGRGVSEHGLLFCIDRDGNLKWSNDTFRDTQVCLWATGRAGYFRQGNDVVIARTPYGGNSGGWTSVNLQTGEMEEFFFGDGNYDVYGLYTLNNETVLYATVTDMGSASNQKTCKTTLRIINTKTFDTCAEAVLEGSVNAPYNIWEICPNKDGTLLLYVELDGNHEMLLLDARLRVIRSLPLGSIGSHKIITWMENDGFCISVRSSEGFSHDVQYHTKRYDRSLNFLWETDFISLSAGFCFFKSPAGEIMAYKALTTADKACCIENYGSEAKFVLPHTHSLVHEKAVAPTCLNGGQREHWYCTGCGVCFSDKGTTPVTDAAALQIPATGHREEEIPSKAPTCLTEGSSNGIKCGICGKILVKPEKIPAKPHTYGEWLVLREPAPGIAGEKERRCTACGADQRLSIDALPPEEIPPVVETAPPESSATEPITQPITESTENLPATTETMPEPTTEPSPDSTEAPPDTIAPTTVPDSAEQDAKPEIPDEGSEEKRPTRLFAAGATAVILIGATAAIIVKKKKSACK